MNEYKCLRDGKISELKTNMKAVFHHIDEMRNIYDNLSKLTDSVHNLTVTMSVFGGADERTPRMAIGLKSQF